MNLTASHAATQSSHAGNCTRLVGNINRNGSMGRSWHLSPSPPARDGAPPPSPRARRAPLTGLPISSSTISRWSSSTVAVGLPSSSTIRSSGRSPARSAGTPFHHRDDLHGAAHVNRRPHPRRQRPRPAGDPEVRAAHTAVRHQRADDPARCLVHRHREAEADAGDRGVHAHHLPAAVGERAAGVAGVESGVGLDHVVDHPPRCRASARAAIARAPTRRRRSPSPRSRWDCRSRPRAGPRGGSRRRPARRAPGRGCRRAARRGRRTGRRRPPRSAARARRRTRRARRAPAPPPRAPR